MKFVVAMLLQLSSVMLASLSIFLSTDVSWHFPCLFHVHFRAENFEPYLSQVLKIRWEDELGKRNPLADKEYRYFGLIFSVLISCLQPAIVDLSRPMWHTRPYCFWQRNTIRRIFAWARFHFIEHLVGCDPKIQSLLIFLVKTWD